VAPAALVTATGLGVPAKTIVVLSPLLDTTIA
jgi:hypothetical protein